MPDQCTFDFYPVENVAENMDDQQIPAKSQHLFPAPLKAVSCVICGKAFECKATSNANACSEICRRERRLRYGAKYRQFGREGRAQVRAMFGGRDPTEGEILDFIKQRRNKP